MPSRIQNLLFLAYFPSISAAIQIGGGLAQNPDFSHSGLVVKTDIVPVNQNHETVPAARPDTSHTEPQTDTPGLLSTRSSQWVHVLGSEEERDQLDCFGGPWNELYITDFLQEKIDVLTGKSNCWLKKGVAGLKELLERNITQIQVPGLSVPTCPVNITSSGNTYSIDFSKNTYHVNTVSKFVFILMTSIHLGCMTLAFFLVYPIILVLSSMMVLCELIERPLLKTRIEKWQFVLHVVFFLPLIVIGMVCGVVGMGLSDHFRTQHGIIGLATVVLATLAIGLYFIERRFRAWRFMDRRWYRIRKIIRYADIFLCQAVLLVSGFALPDGIDDFGVMSLCGTSIISTSLSFSIGMIVGFIWNCAMAAMTLQWWLVNRAKLEKRQNKISLWASRIFRRNADSCEGKLNSDSCDGQLELDSCDGQLDEDSCNGRR
ncbi:hypothetical protein B0J13DRAFT_639716 [Dactylonectria estremocensis]|uniref:Cytochrome b561 domain-containing protein n=1 Tax=Dactylonectria estremocensis TaxID=1079267 RepID=A0A9P9IVR4_9HYPO|nr:hypothetical protein B0J13DRAFT_639716 [Dactylonectria estremocensis]